MSSVNNNSGNPGVPGWVRPAADIAAGVGLAGAVAAIAGVTGFGGKAFAEAMQGGSLKALNWGAVNWGGAAKFGAITAGVAAVPAFIGGAMLEDHFQTSVPSFSQTNDPLIDGTPAQAPAPPPPPPPGAGTAPVQTAPPPGDAPPPPPPVSGAMAAPGTAPAQDPIGAAPPVSAMPLPVDPIFTYGRGGADASALTCMPSASQGSSAPGCFMPSSQASRIAAPSIPAGSVVVYGQSPFGGNMVVIEPPAPQSI